MQFSENFFLKTLKCCVALKSAFLKYELENHSLVFFQYLKLFKLSEKKKLRYLVKISI